MDTDHTPVCAGCHNDLKAGDPFCLGCGRLSPALMDTGPFAVEAQDVPGQKARNRIVKTLRTWFPPVDPLHAEERFRTGWQVLVSGVDEASAHRLQDALQELKIDSRLRLEQEDRSWKERLINPGLAFTGACLLLSVVLGSTAALFLMPVGLAIPFAWALFKARRARPLFRWEEPSPRYEKWSRLANEYAEVIKELGSPDREVVMSLFRTVFDLQVRLSSNSLAAVAAGEDRGDLFARLTDALNTALSLGRRMSDLEVQEAGDLRKELVALARMVSETGEWFQDIDRRPSKEPMVLDKEIREVTERIDRILDQVPGRKETALPLRKPVSA